MTGMLRAALISSIAFVAASFAASAQSADPWPRALDAGGAKLLVHQPQVESWEGNRLSLRAAVVVRPAGGGAESFGAVWATARTRVDRVARLVSLEDVEITRVNFPTAADGGQRYKAALQAKFGGGRRTIALDRLESSLAAGKSAPTTGVAVRNDPPRIVVSEKPAILVPIDGDPVYRLVTGTRFERVINTRALILRETWTGQQNDSVFIRVYDGWLTSSGLAGVWSRPAAPPAGMNAVAAALEPKGRVNLLAGGDATRRPSLSSGVPTVVVGFTPTELIVFEGPPSFQPIAGTGLGVATNTTADVIRDGAGNFYVLLAGRWFRSAALTGPWSHVPSPSLPADFRRIPPDSPAGVMLATIAGTPQAREAAISNSIPQTATVPRVNGPAFTPVFDGAPQFRPIEGTKLQAVVNTASPVIRVDDATFYALRAGVWFHATEVGGPWFVAPSVPAAIYAIPPSSPLHFATYAQVYGSTKSVVYAGYTPGYLGTALNTEGVVVYGTGYEYRSWSGTRWYRLPTTYGVMAEPIRNPATGWSYGFAAGMATTALARAAAYHPANSGAGERCCGSTAVNVYTAYGYAPGSGPQAPPTRPTPPGAATGRYVAPAAPGTGAPTWSAETEGSGVYASANGGVYRRTGDGWQQRTADGWRDTTDDTAELDQERAARADAQAKLSRWNVGASNAGPAGWSDRLGGDTKWDDQAGLGGAGRNVGYGF